ncbi:hypothetical protein K458DRAFT_394588 [Lentithecium fluviatile CBS 122367]|uniref:Uncharacterized protein n=1 Tax=Lentithecium fluviatile CBS 122367 TaxID=1168545 RepID=A0A6G1IKG4_9PLEO|nr:hypothetical protein K458DRAFT_394588 [Lentithecium fluviatile CBS 122367]
MSLLTTQNLHSLNAANKFTTGTPHSPLNNFFSTSSAPIDDDMCSAISFTSTWTIPSQPPEPPCRDLVTLLKQHASFCTPNQTLDITQPIYAPLHGPSIDTKWARERNVAQARETGLLSRPLRGWRERKQSPVERGKNFWVQPEDDGEESSECEFGFDDEEWLASEDEMQVRAESTASPPAVDDETMAMDLDMDYLPSVLVEPVAKGDFDGMEMEDSPTNPHVSLPVMQQKLDMFDVCAVTSTTKTIYPRLVSSNDDEEMTDVDDVVSSDLCTTPSPSADLTLSPASRGSPPFASPSLPVPPSSPFELFCPPGLITVSDAWAFIAHMAQNPGTAFQIQAPKLDLRKAAIFNRKHPIAELLMKALNDPRSSLRTPLANQDTIPFCQIASLPPPNTVAVDRHLGAGVELTLTECMVYFTNHYCQRPLLVRFVRAGLNGGSIANEINMWRQLSGNAAFSHSKVWTRLRRAYPAVPVPDPRGVQTTDFTAQTWKTPTTGIDYPLLALEHGVAQPIRGADAGPLTHLIQWCKAAGAYRAMLSDVPALLQRANIPATIEKPKRDGCPDQAAVERHQKRVAQDRARVLLTRGPG